MWSRCIPGGRATYIHTYMDTETLDAVLCRGLTLSRCAVACGDSINVGAVRMYIRCGERGPSNRVRSAVCGAGVRGIGRKHTGLVRESGLRYLAFRCYWVGSSPLRLSPGKEFHTYTQGLRYSYTVFPFGAHVHRSI
jgi:hypothetical protein